MEWHSELPDGRDVAIRRSGEAWIVECGRSRARSENLDVALAQAIRADTDVVGHADEVHYATWVRGVAARLAES
jgi:hypothetical protein